MSNQPQTFSRRAWSTGRPGSAGAISVRRWAVMPRTITLAATSSSWRYAQGHITLAYESGDPQDEPGVDRTDGEQGGDRERGLPEPRSHKLG